MERVRLEALSKVKSAAGVSRYFKREMHSRQRVENTYSFRAIGGLIITDLRTQAERQALRDAGKDLAMRSDDMSPPEKTFKLQPFLVQHEFNLAEVDPTSITLQKRAYRPLGSLNLRVAGDGYNPTYGTGADIVAD